MSLVFEEEFSLIHIKDPRAAITAGDGQAFAVRADGQIVDRPLAGSDSLAGFVVGSMPPHYLEVSSRSKDRAVVTCGKCQPQSACRVAASFVVEDELLLAFDRRERVVSQHAVSGPNNDFGTILTK